MSDILFESTGGVATITFNDPETLNSLSDDMQFELLRLVDRTAADETVRAVVITGSGKGFCSGANVKKMKGKLSESFEVRAELMMQKHQVAVRIQNSPKIFIALVNGVCFGAGLAIALNCDFRIAAQSARFGTAFAKIGLSGDFGVTWNLTHLVGPAKARELMLLATPIDAAGALAMGLVGKVVPDEELPAEGMRFASEIAQGPSVSYSYIKQNLNAAITSSLPDMIRTEIRNQIHAIRSNDHREAVQAFAEKRKPIFQGN